MIWDYFPMKESTEIQLRDALLKVDISIPEESDHWYDWNRNHGDHE